MGKHQPQPKRSRPPPRLLLLSYVAAQARQSYPDPRFAANLTLYHINQRNVSTVPINMDLADVRGDLYYYLGMEVVHPLECRNMSSSRLAPIDCNASREAETADYDNLVVTSLVLEVDTRWTSYSDCNKEAEFYHCSPYGPINSSVGRFNLTNYGEKAHGHQNLSTIDYWRYNTVDKTSGFWYSTLKDGYCGNSNNNSNSGTGCTWRVVQVNKRVARRCFDQSFFGAVIAADRRSCFSACPQPSNASSSCFIKCVYDTALGPKAGSGLGPAFLEGGMDMALLEHAWERPFKSSDLSQGGCPSI